MYVFGEIIATSNVITFYIYLLNIHVGVCDFLYVHHMCAVPVKARRGQQSPLELRPQTVRILLKPLLLWLLLLLVCLFVVCLFVCFILLWDFICLFVWVGFGGCVYVCVHVLEVYT